MSPWEVHPLRIADGLLTLNELSGGRATILIGGLGHSVTRVTGLEPVRRVTAVRDTLRILKGLRPDAMLNYEGELYSLKNYQAEWATQPPPRIYAGATFSKMMRMAAGVADGTMMSDVPLQRMPEVMGWVGEGLAEGRPPARRLPHEQLHGLAREGGPGSGDRRGAPRADLARPADDLVHRAVPGPGRRGDGGGEAARIPPGVPRAQLPASRVCRNRSSASSSTT